MRLALGLAVVALVGACALRDPGQVLPVQRKAAVKRASESFSDALRWGRLEEAAALVHPDQRAEFRSELAELEDDLRFTSYEIEGVTLGPGLDQANAKVRFELYRLPSVAEETLRDDQRWRYDLVQGSWYLEPDLALYRGKKR
jgi:hypothetical protein